MHVHVQAQEELAYYDGSHARPTEEEQAETMHQRLVLDGGKDSSSMPDPIPTPEEPTVKQIHNLARDGISKLGLHEANCAMIVLRKGLLHRDDIQILAGKKATKYLLDNSAADMDLVVSPYAKGGRCLSFHCLSPT